MGRKRSNGMLLSAGEFTGVPLAAILELAGVRPGAVSVRLEGADFGRPNSDVEPFYYDKALPLEKALEPDTIVAWALNGEYLDHVHGAPARAVVPGWSGNWHVKWLQRIEVLDHPGECWYQTEYYVYGQSLENHEGMLTLVPSKSIVTFPGPEGATLPRGRHVIRGLAWSGAGRVAQVEVSIDGGTTWRQARLEPPAQKWMWVRWSLPWDFDQPGRYVIKARAIDEAGRVQGSDPRYEDRARNFLLKNFAGIIRVELTIHE
jgi:DMSO/TMAO reductase YedYZ molybdopterin-dependent catalytic subunit